MDIAGRSNRGSEKGWWYDYHPCVVCGEVLPAFCIGDTCADCIERLEKENKCAGG